MKKRTWILILSVFIFAALSSLVLIACHSEDGDSTGHVELSSISFSDGRDASGQHEYDITRLIVRAEKDGRGTTEEVMSLPHDLGELREGIWNIMVDAYDSRGNFISTCSKEIEVDADDMLDLRMAFELPDPRVDVPNGRFLRVDPHAPFTLSANYRPMRIGEDYSYTWTIWPTDTDSPSTHVVDTHGDPTLSSDAFWQIWDWYGGDSDEFAYTVDVSSADGSASFSGRISVVEHT